jgi:hypothetical protein
MSRAIHRLKSVSLFVLVNQIHIILVLKEVATDLPQLLIVHIWRDDFLIATNLVFITHQIKESIVNFCTLGEKEGASWSQWTKVKEALFGSN